MTTEDCNFCAERFVDQLLTNGMETPCDDTNAGYNKAAVDVPEFYDETKFKRAQRFYHHNISAAFFSKLLGLMAVISVPTIKDILIFTRMSSDAKTAYKRYISTILHMQIWYQKDFHPGSLTWSSIEEIRGKHNSASRKACKRLKNITQADMALTQFGFMGFIVTRPKELNLSDVTEENMECIVHFWKVIGHMLGIEERYNICRDSPEETREICEKIIERVFRPEVEKQDNEFVGLINALINGLWCFQPILNPKSTMLYLMKLLKCDEAKCQQLRDEMNRKERFYFWLMSSIISVIRFTSVRVIQNYAIYLNMWVIEHFPLLAIYMFGVNDAYVKMINEPVRASKRG